MFDHLIQETIDAIELNYDTPRGRMLINMIANPESPAILFAAIDGLLFRGPMIGGDDPNPVSKQKRVQQFLRLQAKGKRI